MAQIIQSEGTSDTTESTTPVAVVTPIVTPEAPVARAKTHGGLIASVIIFVALVFGGYYLFAKSHGEPVLSKATVTDAVSSVTPSHKPE